MPQPQKRVLVVDDEPLVCRSIGMMLQHCGYGVKTTCRGEDALGLIETQPFDLVLTDLRMVEGLQGDELAREIRKRKPALPIVMVTGDAQEQPSADYAMVLLKPFLLTELESVLASLCGTSEPEVGREPEFQVVEIQGRYSLQAYNSSGRVCFLLANQDQVVNQTAKALNAQFPRPSKVRLTAPKWIQAELRKRGYDF